MSAKPSHPLEALLREIEERLISHQDSASGEAARALEEARARQSWPAFKLRLLAEISKANALFAGLGWSFAYEDASETAGAIARGVLKLRWEPLGLVDDRPVVMRRDGDVTFDSTKDGRYRLPAADATDADVQVMLSVIFRECESLPWLAALQLAEGA